MARYSAEILRPEVSYSDAVDRLAHMDDEVLATVLRPDMFIHHLHLTHRAWRVDEPEHESLMLYLRHQVRADLLAAYFGERDYLADERLAFAQTLPYPTLIYFTPFDENEEEDDDFGICNPVYRLNVLGICHGASEPLTITLDMNNTADGYPVPVATDVPITFGSNTVYSPTTSTINWTTATTPRPPRRRTVTPITREDLSQDWLNANADIARLRGAYTRNPVNMSDLDVVDELHEPDEPDSDDMRF